MESNEFMQIIHQDEVLDDLSLDLLKGGAGNEGCIINFCKPDCSPNCSPNYEEPPCTEDEAPPCDEDVICAEDEYCDAFNPCSEYCPQNYLA